jgi:hypothetical protein
MLLMSPKYEPKRKGTEFHINLFPRQAEFINSDCDEVLFGGAAGGGKSFSLLAFALKRRLEFPNSVGIILRRTFPELDRSIIRESFKIYSNFDARYQSAKHRWEFSNGSVQEFGYCDNDADAYKYHSAEYSDVCFDEASQFNEFIMTYIASRCRTTNPDMKSLIRLASNPGNVGHAYLYERFIKPWHMEKKWFNDTEKKWMTFIPAKISDNPALAEADPNYINRLRSLPEQKYLALAEGRWDVFEGAYFTQFNPTHGKGVTWNYHKPEGYTRKIIGLDWGYAEPACALWMEITPMGRIFIYRELYGTQMGPKALATKILEMTPPEEKIDYLTASPEIWGKTADMEGGGETIQQLMEQVLSNRFPMQKANNARVPGWQKVREFMAEHHDTLSPMEEIHGAAE